MSAARTTRAARGLLSAGVATFVALFFHVVGGGDMPNWLGVLAPLTLSAPFAILLAGRSLSSFRMLVSVGMTQAMFHLMFSWGSYGSSGSVHQHDDVLAANWLPGVSTNAVNAADASMGVAHVMAALVTTAVLVRGERAYRAIRAALVRFATWVRRAATPALGVALAGRPCRVLLTADRTVLPRGLRVPATGWRGPPVTTASF